MKSIVRNAIIQKVELYKLNIYQRIQMIYMESSHSKDSYLTGECANIIRLNATSSTTTRSILCEKSSSIKSREQNKKL